MFRILATADRKEEDVMALKVFISYAHQDRELCQALENHLSNLKRQGVIASWSDGALIPGTEWEPQILHHLNTAQIILLLVSADFMASDFCYSVEMTRALERHQANQARVIPILLRPTDWQGSPFAALQMLPRDRKPVTTWSSLDEALAHVVQGIRAAIDDLTRGEQTLAPSATRTLPAIWNIPYPRNPYFTGREHLLTRLATTLRAGQTVGISQPQAVSGLGGVGKTQIALEYAYRYHQDYNAVLWTRADTQEALISGFVSLANLLSLPLQEERDQLKIVQSVKTRLTTHPRWLLILDNADDLSLLQDFLPPAGRGHTLLTTRAASTGRLAQRIEVDTLDKEPGALLLLRRTGRLAPDTTLDQAAASDRTLALTITEELGGLPLALDQAGAYIEEIQCSLADYLQLYRSQRTELLKVRGGLVPDHPEPVATTWSLSFTQVEQRSPAAADLLRLCAFLHPDAIPEEIITQGATHLGRKLKRAVSNPFTFNQAIGVLLSYSLLKRNAKEHLLSIHRLVQAVLKDGMDAYTHRLWAKRMVQAVNAALPDEVDYRTTAHYERCLSHAQECALLIGRFQLTSAIASRLLYQTGRYLLNHARYAKAETLIQHCLSIREQALGPQHPDVARSYHSLAELYRKQGQYAQAEKLYQQALSFYRQAQESQHPDVARSYHSLAELYRKQGKYDQAEPLYKRAQYIWEQALGPEHPDVAYPLNGLAILYREQGKYAQAESLFLQARRIREQTQGQQHPDVTYPLHNLAILYREQGKYAEAESLFLQALSVYEQALGPEHPDVAYPLHNLAELYRKQGKYDQAKQLYQQALSIYGQALGPEHPKVAHPLDGLATLYEEQGKYIESEPLYLRALRIWELALGPDHPLTRRIVHDYASLLRKLGRETEALQLEARFPSSS